MTAWAEAEGEGSSLVAIKDGAAERLDGAPPQTVLRWVWERFGARSGISCSFGGPGGVVLASMAARERLPIPILFIDTDFLFPETYAMKERLEREWGLTVRTGRAALSPEAQEEAYGPALWSREPDLCCRIRKVEPMASLLQEIDCWVTALRRDQSPTRRTTRLIETHRLGDGRMILKVNPLFDWSRKQLWQYVHEHQLPYNPLLDEGYGSLGCIHCTARTEGGDERAGRWVGRDKTECGLHTFTERS